MDNSTRPDWLTEAVGYAEGWLDVQMRQTDTLGAVFAAADAHGLVAERAFGLADLALAMPMTPQHRFRVASHSKTFTAGGILMLPEADDAAEIEARLVVSPASWADGSHLLQASAFGKVRQSPGGV